MELFLLLLYKAKHALGIYYSFMKLHKINMVLTTSGRTPAWQEAFQELTGMLITSFVLLFSFVM